MAHAIYEFWVIWDKDLHGDDDLFIWAFPNCLQCSFALNPLNHRWFCNLLCKLQMWACYICIWGVFLQGFQWWGAHGVLCHSWKQDVSPDPEASKSFVCNNFSFSASEIVVPPVFQILFHVFFNSSSPMSAPTYCHMCEAGFQHLLHLRVSNSPTLLRLRNHRFTFMVVKCLLCFDDHAMTTCYLHIHKAQTKPLQCK